eukprot:5317852-Pyramimonas_sp.AAC.1
MQRPMLEGKALGSVDHVYMEFASAAEDLLLARLPDARAASDGFRGSYPESRLVPLLATKPA